MLMRATEKTLIEVRDVLRAFVQSVKSDINQLKDDIAYKLDKPANTPQVGKVLKIKAVNEDGTFLCEWGESDSGGGGSVYDVKIGDDSVVQDGVAKIPYASVSYPYKPGVIQFSSGRGLRINDMGSGASSLSINNATTDAIKNRNKFYNNSFGAITSENFDYAVKAAMCDGIGSAWTDTERIAALLRMGCTVDDNGFVLWTAQEVAE